MIGARSLHEFQDRMMAHEQLLEGILEIDSINKSFSDFPGTLKSLGAWGGDLFLAASRLEVQQVQAYFKAQGLLDIIPLEDLMVS